MMQNSSSRNVTIGSNTILGNMKNIITGDNSYINSGIVIAGQKSKIVIGNNYMIAHNVYLRADTHNYDKINIPMIQQGNTEKDIIIRDDVWIGNRVQIMPGVRIGNGAIIGAGCSVVTKDVPPMSIFVGIPTKILRNRIN